MFLIQIVTFADYTNGETMASKSALKRVRSNEVKRLRNKYQHKTARTFIKRLKATTDRKQGEELLAKVVSNIDKLAKNNIIHKNKAGNLKSKLTRHVASL